MLKLTIKVGPNTTDYSDYVDWKSVQIQDQLNVPTKLTFVMYALNWAFRIPVQRAYVRLYASSSDRSLFTGLLSVEPTKEFVGLAAAGFRILGPTGNNLQDNAGQILKYTCTATSEDYLLSLKATPFIPAYINRTQGQILADLAETLCPGYFDTTNIQDGDIVPYFNYDPTKSWSEVAKTFGDASRFRYKALDKKLFYVPYGDADLGISYDEVNQSESQFDPNGLKTTVLQVPTVNDVMIIGDTEGGNNHEDYFCGDGFTGNLQLQHKVFQGSSVVLLQDALTSNQLNTQNWYQQDPGDNFHWEAGAFNVVTDTSQPFGADGISVLGAQNGLELAGGLNLQHGEFIFNDYCSGVLGGLYQDQTYADTEFLCGFRVTTLPEYTTSASGAAGVVIQPMFGESPVGVNAAAPSGTLVVTQPNHTYVLQTIVHAPAYTRWTQTYRTVDGEEYGGGSLSMTGSVTFNIQDYDIGAATGFYYTPEISSVTIQEVTLPDFSAYALVNNDVLNVTDTNLLIAKMPLGGLSGLLGSLGLFTPSGLSLPAMQSDYIWGIPPSGNYWGQPVPPAPAAGNINHSPVGNQYYVGSVSTWGIVVASTSQGGSAGSVVQHTNNIDFGDGWQDYVGGTSGPVIIPGAVTEDTSGPNGGQRVIDVLDSVSQAPLRTHYGNPGFFGFDLIKNWSPAKDFSISGSTNPNNDRFVLSIQQTQAVISSVILQIWDTAGHRAYFIFYFDAASCFNAWITVTAPRSGFTTDSGMDWTQIDKMEMYGGGTCPYTSFILFFAEARWVGLVATAPVDPTVTSNFVSLIADPLMNIAPAAGEVAHGWTNTSDDSGLGPNFNFYAARRPAIGHPQIPGSASVALGMQGGPPKLAYYAPGADSKAARVSQNINLAGVSISPGDQYTIGVYGMTDYLEVNYHGMELRFGLSATVTYADGFTSTAAAGGVLASTNIWEQGSNQLLIDPVRQPVAISISLFAYIHNPKTVPTDNAQADWYVYLTAAELIKTPSAYSIYPAPVGLSTVPTNLVLGNGFDLQAAQITQGNDADTLAFYAQTNPTAGTPIRFQSWESQAAVSRLQEQDSITYEAYVTGDDGVRSAIVSNLSPLPRTSEDCDNAAQAFLADRTTTGYNGTYTCTNKFFTPPVIINPEDGYGLGGYGLTPYGGTVLNDQYWPVTGRFLHINAPPRGIAAQKYLVTGLQTSVLDEVTELVQFQITFGADLQLEKVLHNFVDLQPASVLTPQDKANPPNPRNVVDVSTTYLPDLSATYIPLGAITPTQVYVSFNDTIPAGAWLEIRLLDTNWGDFTKRDFVGRFSPATGGGFWLARKSFDQNWFMRLVAPASVSGGSGSMTYAISGNVIGVPEGTTIEIIELDVIVLSDAAGNWRFTGIGDGIYTIRPSLTGYTFTPQAQAITVNGTDVSGLHFSGSIGVYSVSGLLTDHNGVPLVGGSVSWSGPGSGAITVSTQGNYVFFALPGTYTVTASLAGYQASSTTVTVTGGSVGGVNFILYTTVTYAISGVVLDENGTALAGIAVIVINTGTSETRTVLANGSGFYSILVPNGSYTVQPSASGHSFYLQPVTVAGAAVGSVNFGAGKTLPTLTGIPSSLAFGTPTLSSARPPIQFYSIGTGEAFGATPNLVSSPLLQKVVNYYTGGTTVSATFANNVTAGSTLFIFGLTGNNPTISDTLGNTYTANPGGDAFYCFNALGGPNTVTLTFATAPGWATLIACEFTEASSGNGIDQTASNGTNSASPVSGAITTTVNGALILAYCTGGHNYDAGPGYLLVDNSTGDTVELMTQPTAGSVTASFLTAVSDYWYVTIWSLKPKP